MNWRILVSGKYVLFEITPVIDVINDVGSYSALRWPVQGPLVKWHLVARASQRCINTTLSGDSGCSGMVGCLVRVHRHPRIPICRPLRLILLRTKSMTTLGVVLHLAEKNTEFTSSVMSCS